MSGSFANGAGAVAGHSSGGFVAHAAGPMEGGYRVVEIWDSREELERFLQQTIMPMAQRVGLPPFPPQILPVDNVLTR